MLPPHDLRPLLQRAVAGCNLRGNVVLARSNGSSRTAPCTSHRVCAVTVASIAGGGVPPVARRHRWWLVPSFKSIGSSGRRQRLPARCTVLVTFSLRCGKGVLREPSCQCDTPHSTRVPTTAGPWLHRSLHEICEEGQGSFQEYVLGGGDLASLQRWRQRVLGRCPVSPPRRGRDRQPSTQRFAGDRKRCAFASALS